MAAFPETFFLGGGGVCAEDVMTLHVTQPNCFRTTFFLPKVYSLWQLSSSVCMSLILSLALTLHTHTNTRKPPYSSQACLPLLLFALLLQPPPSSSLSSLVSPSPICVPIIFPRHKKQKIILNINPY